jgi:hypothetical protein
MNILIALLFTIDPLCSHYCIMSNDTSITDSMKPQTLHEVVVTASAVRHKPGKDVYAVFDELLRGASNPLDMMDRLPGVSYDNMANSLSVRNDKRVQLQVDGLERSYDYVRAIKPDRVKRIEVVRMLPGRLVAAGYKYVVNIMLKKDYIGNDLFLQNYNMIATTGKNGDDRMANEQPKGYYLYSGRKFNVSASYGYADIKWNYPLSFSKTYKDVMDVKTIDYTTANPNDHNTHRSHNASMGFDYYFKDNDVLSFRSSYSYVNEGHNTMYETDETWLNDSTKRRSETSLDKERSNNVMASLIYKTMIGSSWNVYSEVNYNYYGMKSRNAYIISDGFATNDRYRNRKNYINWNLDLTYNISESQSMNFGYTGTWNQYRSFLSDGGRMLSKSTDRRNNIYAYFSDAFSDKLTALIGAAAERIGMSSLSDRHNYWEWLPKIQLSYIPSANAQLVFEYSSTVEYPKLYQLSLASYNTDRLMTFTGNPSVKPARKSTLSVQSTFWDRLIFGASYEYTKNFIADYYTKTDGDYQQSFVNSKYSYLVLLASYDWKISKYLSFRNTLQWTYDANKYGSINNHFTNLMFESRVNYWMKSIKLWLSATYSRSMVKEPMLQGWNENGQDLWQLTLQRSFFNNMMNVSLSYVPPFRLGMRDEQRKMINTDFYNERQTLNLHTYDNMLMLRISFNLHKGKKVKQEDVNHEFDDENKKDRGLL